jgi:hypothetical protein
LKNCSIVWPPPHVAKSETAGLVCVCHNICFSWSPKHYILKQELLVKERLKSHICCGNKQC